MKSKCPSCNHELTYVDAPPRFCSECGARISTSQGPVFLATEDMPTELNVPSTASGVNSGTQITPLVPTELGGFVIQRELGRGGMGVVYEAIQADTGRPVALKVLGSNLPRTQDAVHRFLSEGSLAARLSHPRTTFVFSAGEDSGHYFIAMELMPGTTLKDIAERESPLPVERAVDYILDVIEGLQAAHALRIIHRDVKPSNCFLDGTGRIKVGDFGLAKSLAMDLDLTRTGMFLGTVQFAAPEQLRGSDLDERADIYSVGAMLFFLLAGRCPFVGDAASIIAQVSAEKAPSLRKFRKDVPVDLEGVVAKALERDPAKRHQSMSQLHTALLPFASRGKGVATIGRRSAAYAIDAFSSTVLQTFLGGILGGIVGATLAVKRVQTQPLTEADRIRAQFELQQAVAIWAVPMSAFVGVLFFTIAEGYFKHGLGKWLLGLQVVGPSGERAGFWRCFLRSLGLPGVFGIALLIDMFLTLNASLGLEWNFMGNAGKYLAILLVVSSMRAANGYRGLHELVSGTRTILVHNPNAVARLRSVRNVTSIPLSMPLAFGPYRVVGVMGNLLGARVYHAMDDMLQRTVWVLVRPAGHDPFTASRRALSRITRLRLLQSGNSEHGAWDAFEALEGAPITDAAGPGGKVPWEAGRHVLLDLAEELSASISDGTVPHPLGLNMIWVDSDSALTLLDGRLTPDVFSANPSDWAEATDALTVADPEARAVQFFRQAVELCTGGGTLPAHATAFLQELANQPDTKLTLDWAAVNLRKFRDLPARITWDERLGMMAISFGAESTVMLASIFVILAMSLMRISALDVMGKLAICITVLMVVIFLAGYYFSGGPVFRFLGMQVMTLKDKPASKLRCGIRNLVAWTPSVVSQGSLFVLVTLLGPSNPEKLMEMLKDNILMVMLCGLAALVASAISTIGAIYAIVSPARGLQDYLCGTKLTPK